MARMSPGHFIALSRWEKNRCLVDSNAESALPFASRLRTSLVSWSTIPLAFSASSRFAWMIWKALAYWS